MGAGRSGAFLRDTRGRAAPITSLVGPLRALAFGLDPPKLRQCDQVPYHPPNLRQARPHPSLPDLNRYDCPSKFDQLVATSRARCPERGVAKSRKKKPLLPTGTGIVQLKTQVSGNGLPLRKQGAKGRGAWIKRLVEQLRRSVLAGIREKEQHPSISANSAMPGLLPCRVPDCPQRLLRGRASAAQLPICRAVEAWLLPSLGLAHCTGLHAPRVSRLFARQVPG